MGCEHCKQNIDGHKQDCITYVDSRKAVCRNCYEKSIGQAATSEPQLTDEEIKKQAKIDKKRRDDNFWEAIKFAWSLTDDAAWKITRFRKFLIGKVGKSKVDKKYGEEWHRCQLSDDPATVTEIVGFYHWYNYKYKGVTMPEKGETLLNHFQTFRGEEKYIDYMEKAQKTIINKIPKIKPIDENGDDEVFYNDDSDNIVDDQDTSVKELMRIAAAIPNDEINLPPIDRNASHLEGQEPVSEEKRIELEKVFKALVKMKSANSKPGVSKNE
jgi:hypothetical protein